MKAVLPLFVFVDACGWEIIRNDPFARAFAPHRRRLESVFGYSSACVPSIVSGAWPAEHRNWCYFVYDPKRSPFRMLRLFRWLPQSITSRRRFRRWLSKFLQGPLKFRGYFDLYNIPFEYISLFDFSEKRSPLKPGGMNRGGNIFDFLEIHNIPYHVSDPANSETENLTSLIGEIRLEQIDFAFVYWPDLDGLLHMVGNKSAEVPAKLRVYEQRLEQLLTHAHEHYQEVRLYIFSDHGMANCTEYLDLKSIIERLAAENGLKFGRDYVVAYDSTMARFWFPGNDADRRAAAQPAATSRARELIANCLNQIPEGRIVPDAELARLRTLFADRHFGELIFLVKEGVLIVPSHMGQRPIRAMHGYHPEEPHSYAALLSNRFDIPTTVSAIPHIYDLMVSDALSAHSANAAPISEEELLSLQAARAAQYVAF
ncbi:MAG TPA: alkaline phosphatase family protein [Candidatus Binatia bacterium]|nr:alkaline phosphatase family protein [Candidatus Binatia bacterium]